MAEASPTRSRRSEDKREAILAVACEAFFAQGYDGASMSEIAERVGGSKGTLYNHFRSKEDLFRAVVEKKGVELYAALDFVRVECGDLAEDLVQFGVQLLRIILSDEYVAFYRLLVSVAGRIETVSSDRYGQRRDLLLGRLAARLRDEMRAQRLAIADPMEAAEVFWNLCGGSIHRRALLANKAVPRGDRELRRHAERAVEIFLAAFGAR